MANQYTILLLDASKGQHMLLDASKRETLHADNRVRDLLKEFGSMACMSPVLEKANQVLIGEAPGQRPGDW